MTYPNRNGIKTYEGIEDNSKETFAKSLTEKGILEIENMNPKKSENGMVISFFAAILCFVSFIFALRKKGAPIFVLGITGIALIASVTFTPQFQIESSSVSAFTIALISAFLGFAGIGLSFMAKSQKKMQEGE